MGLPVLVQGLLGGSGDPPNATTYGSPVTSGNVLVGTIHCAGNGTLGTVSFADTVNAGNWNQLTLQNDATNSSTVGIFWIVTAGGTPTVTATCSTPEYSNICIAEYSGLTGTITVDSTGTTFASGSSATVTDTPVNNAHANSLLICACMINFGWNTAPSVWAGVGGTTQTGQYYAAQASATNTPFSGTLGSSAIWDVATGILYGASGGGGGVVAPSLTFPPGLSLIRLGQV